MTARTRMATGKKILMRRLKEEGMTTRTTRTPGVLSSTSGAPVVRSKLGRDYDRGKGRESVETRGSQPQMMWDGAKGSSLKQVNPRPHHRSMANSKGYTIGHV
jgi:hypothetical protein